MKKEKEKTTFKQEGKYYSTQFLTTMMTNSPNTMMYNLIMLFVD